MQEILLILFGLLITTGLGIILFRLLKSKTSDTGQETILRQEAELVQLRARVEGLEPLRDKVNELSSALSAAMEKARMHEEQGTAIRKQLQEKESLINELHIQLSRKTTENEGLIEKLSTLKKDIENLQDNFRNEFKNLANDILEEKTKKFTEQNRTKLDEILKPLSEKIREFEKKVEDTYDKESKQRFSLEKEIKNLAELNQQISKEANNLTHALKGQTKTQGNWGEIILESILDKSGLVREREYFVQASYTSEHGKRQQPDVVIAYPGERSLVVDSKVSLLAYERYSSAETKEEQDKALKEHLLSVRNHISELSAKNYQDLYQLKTLDFVILFMPVEPAYLIAMQAEPDIWSYAYERRVLLISPTNLIAVLRMISNLWRVEYQNKNAIEIARQSADLLDKFVGFLEDLEDIGRKLESTRQSYDASMNKLSTGKGNLIRRAEKIKELGAKPSKEIPRTLLDKTEE
ncbi:MAG: DNA recombination protein RmuC [Bacteroidetes bacterium]|nr:DNA recombination protein RmuC [Bacteroidota bacterium]